MMQLRISDIETEKDVRIDLRKLERLADALGFEPRKLIVRILPVRPRKRR